MDSSTQTEHLPLLESLALPQCVPVIGSDASSELQFQSHLLDTVRKLERDKISANNRIADLTKALEATRLPEKSLEEIVSSASSEDKPFSDPLPPHEGLVSNHEDLSWRVIHWVGSPKQKSSSNPRVYYLDEPRTFWREARPEDLKRFESLENPPPEQQTISIPQTRGAKTISDLERYIKNRSRMAFVVVREYKPEEKPFVAISPKDGIGPEDTTPLMITERIRLCSTAAISAFKHLEDHVPGFHLPSTKLAPYLPFFHYQDVVRAKLANMAPAESEAIQMLLEYINQHYTSEYEEAAALISRSQISIKHIEKIFRPGDVLVSHRRGDLRGYLCQNWPDDPSDSAFERSRAIFRTGTKFTLSCYRWVFNGDFWKESVELPVAVPTNRSPINITDLSVYPLRFAPERVESTLRNRGQVLWSCRHRRYVVHHGDQSRGSTQNARFMIDYNAYRELHPASKVFDRPLKSDLEKHILDQEALPGDDFVYLQQPKIDGFAMHEKRWRTLLVDQLAPIDWNKSAFSRLVLRSDKKELVEALVKIHLNKRRDVDVIEGKGNGLIVLLHGGPGTGKTFTAEGVAELAEKPLYRVTCGDIGTDPEGVEQYLESVLYIGRLWGCVVLLDEADVFLEERSLTDLQRNALVSVFLRVLEYYEGILILTSNRVGIFDQAFKSRIRLALHYPALGIADRRKLWRNFINGLRDSASDETPVNFDDLMDNLDNLAAYEMNGRQIRNAVATASDLAQFRGKELIYEHFEHVVQIAGQFETYLEQMRGHTDDQWSRSEGIRFN